MPLIRVLKCTHDERVPLTLGEQRFMLHVKGDPERRDGLNDVPAIFIPLLNDSHIEYEIVAPVVAGQAKGGEAPGGKVATPRPPRKRQPKAKVVKPKAPSKPKAASAPAAKGAPKPKTGMTTTASLGFARDSAPRKGRK